MKDEYGCQEYYGVWLVEVSQIPEADETRQVEHVPPPTFPFSPSHSPDHSWGSPTKLGDTSGEGEGGGGETENAKCSSTPQKLVLG